MKCKKTLTLQPTNILALTVGQDYEITDTDETGIYIKNNKGDLHHFSLTDQEIYFEYIN